ncbi:hypothetical protein WR25_08613 isoform B [Diploscapter pachys]|uniref:Endoplasmic reticulum-Golgi intermediate compartment protein 3 n=1 Tax=Diploscapter pachys TaxID=2018661 RepID=A0A2A2L099_9BILA|nr:hypothetical protein WR25_08613 isoform B [Diploscapter pachys]
MVSIFSMVREFDAYTKPMEDFRVKTLSGGFVTLIASIVIICLTVLETYSFLSTEVVEQLYVDSSTSDIRVDIHFDIIFHRLPCGFVTVDVMDVSSDTQENIQHDIYKLRIDKNGLNISDTVQKMEANTNKSSVASASPSALPACGSCYGALPEGSCCNTCDEVKNAYAGKGWQVNIEEVEQCKSDEYLKQYTEQKGEGCRVYGKVQVWHLSSSFKNFYFKNIFQRLVTFFRSPKSLGTSILHQASPTELTDLMSTIYTRSTLRSSTPRIRFIISRSARTTQAKPTLWMENTSIKVMVS